MKIKVIDLLNKIANGEYPKRFKYNGKIYEYKKIIQGTGYVTEDYNWFNDITIDDWNNLNDEVEIIEEDKPIEELKIARNEKDNQIFLRVENHHATMRKIDVVFATKINELVKEINKMKEKLNGKNN